MGHFSFYRTIVLLIIILGATGQASGLRCYGDSGGPEQCTGSCAIMTALEDGTSTRGQQLRRGDSMTDCLPDTMINGCMDQLILGIQTRVCTCSTDFCNDIGTNRVGTNRVVANRVKRYRDYSNEAIEGTTTEAPSAGPSGALLGGIIGGVALLMVVVVVICCCCCNCCNNCTILC